MAGIIVGVDGSDHSRRALSWAMREAAKAVSPGC
jgi:nucleotide-binding universal stress UspA family protein